MLGMVAAPSRRARGMKSAVSGNSPPIRDWTVRARIQKNTVLTRTELLPSRRHESAGGSPGAVRLQLEEHGS